MWMKLILAAAAAACVAGCASGNAEPLTPAVALPPDWRAVATPHDRERVREWRSAWMEGLRKAHAAGHGAALIREGRLLQPDAALEWREPPPGDYRCRVLKVGAKASGLPDFTTYPPYACRIRREKGMMSFAKLTGSQRPIGHLLPVAAQPRMVFLGTLQLGDERRSLEYGHDRERDMAGLIERIDEQRWRLVLPYPAFESTIDVLELVPVGTPAPRT
jgi:hypothetical protein